jgi:putative membrane protein
MRTESIPTTHKVMLAMMFGIFVWSLVCPFDWFTWFLEMLPVAIAMPILLLTYRRFRLTNLVYLLIFVHMVILLIGAKYTYAREPLFDWLKELFGWTRNNYDRLGHFAQGFVPAILAREILLRKTPLRPGKMLFFLVLCVCMFISSTFELFEWSVAMATGAKADDYLAFQGDAWDTQNDMAMCLVGAITAMLTLRRIHDRQLLMLHDTGQ